MFFCKKTRLNLLRCVNYQSRSTSEIHFAMPDYFQQGRESGHDGPENRKFICGFGSIADRLIKVFRGVESKKCKRNLLSL